MIQKLTLYAAVFFCLTFSCSAARYAASTERSKPEKLAGSAPQTAPLTGQDGIQDTLPRYNPSYGIINDIVHTKLDVQFDWKKKYMYGKAWVTLHPHFYATDTLTLDAKGFNINKVELVNAAGNNIPLLYVYDSSTLRIWLNRTYDRNENYTVFIDYTAKPYERKTSGSWAITDSKGLYFINADGKNTEEPQQLWTQGETEYNSAWFPTVDKPDMKHTTEISMTVDTGFVTLSNGLMVNSVDHHDGTRTDTWKMDQPFAPYLTMMAAGHWKIYHDSWMPAGDPSKKIEVNYYMEPEYFPYAKEIFGNTPEMISFYSHTLGVNYPWPKFSQVIVREFVSGAMENVTAVVHYDALNQTHREMIDGNHEDIVAHELFHHWFGDLVTCESWANIPLNESFAAYSETLWLTYKYGADEGDAHWNDDLSSYLDEAATNPKILIRYGYKDKEDMFDAHSYQKGARILGLLRNYLGDSAFFRGLHVYLTRNLYKTGEVHDLREAFEAVTGQDLNWFFNQWFLTAGHPHLQIYYHYQPDANLMQVKIIQTEKQANAANTGDADAAPEITNPLFILPMKVDVYTNGQVKRYPIIMNQREQVFNFPAYSKPDLVNVDADKVMLCDKEDHKSDSAFVFQYFHAPLYMDRLESISHCKELQDHDSLARVVILAAGSDKFWKLREEAAADIMLDSSYHDSYKKARQLLISLAQYDPRSGVRNAALSRLGELDDSTLLPLFVKAMNDSSYEVIGTALNLLSHFDAERARTAAARLENEKESSIVAAVASIYADYGTAAQNGYFVSRLSDKSNKAKYSLLGSYGRFLKRQDIPVRDAGLEILLGLARSTNDPWWIRYGAMNAVSSVKQAYKSDQDSFQNVMEKYDQSSTQYTSAKAAFDSLDKKITDIETRQQAIKDAEENETLKSLYKNY